MSAQYSMLQNVRNRCGAMVVDFTDDVILSFLQSAMVEFYPAVSALESLDSFGKDVCVLRACEMSCHRAAADYAVSFKFKSPDFEGDPSMVTRSILALAAAFRKELDAKIVVIGGGRMKIGTALMFTDEPRSGTEPMSVNSPAVASTVATSLGVTSEGWGLSWTPSTDTTFSSYMVYMVEGSAAVSAVQRGDFSPAVVTTARRVLTTRDRHRSSCLIKNVEAGKTYTAVVVVCGNSGVFSYSNELTITA